MTLRYAHLYDARNITGRYVRSPLSLMTAVAARGVITTSCLLRVHMCMGFMYFHVVLLLCVCVCMYVRCIVFPCS